MLRPVQPMLASTAAGVAEAIEALGRSSVEWKLDGARIQAHRPGERCGCSPATERRDLPSPGVVAAVAAWPVRRFVLDGEVLGSARG